MLVLTGIILTGIVAVILIIVVFQPQRSNKDFPKFYNDNLLVLTNDAPLIVKQALGVENDPTCWQGNLELISGEVVSFHWWQWHIRSTVYAGGAPRQSFKNFLAVSFPPNVVSEEFEQKAIRGIQTDEFSQKLVNALVVDSRTPIRAQKLDDGSLLICWQVSEQAKVLKGKIDWLKNNVTIRNQAKNVEKVLNKNVNYQVAAADTRGKIRIVL